RAESVRGAGGRPGDLRDPSHPGGPFRPAARGDHALGGGRKILFCLTIQNTMTGVLLNHGRLHPKPPPTLEGSMHSQIRKLILGGLGLALCAAPALAGQPTAQGSFVSPRVHLFSTGIGGGPYLGCCGYVPTPFKVTVGGGTALPAGEHVE